MYTRSLNRILFSSRPGGGLFGRPVTPTSPGRLCFCAAVWHDLFLSRIRIRRLRLLVLAKLTVVLLLIPPDLSRFLSLRMSRDRHFVALFRYQHSRAGTNVVGQEACRRKVRESCNSALHRLPV